MTYRIGVDLGGTKVEVIALDPSGEAVFSKRISTPKGDYQGTVNTIVELVDCAESFLEKDLDADLTDLPSVGVGIPGSISARTGLIRNANSVVLIGKDLKGDLEKRLNRPIGMANDANCFVLSEAVDGAAKDVDTVFGVILGTGCGGALVVDQQILEGSNAIAGEWGHNPLPWVNFETEQTGKSFPNLDCYCGLKGCNETFLSGSAIEKHFILRGGEALTAKEIVTLSEHGNALAEEMIEDYIVWLAKGLASVINLFDPDAIVLGGGISNIQRLYTDVPAIWEQWVFNNEPVNTLLLPPRFGDASGVRGAAWLQGHNT